MRDPELEPPGEATPIFLTLRNYVNHYIFVVLSFCVCFGAIYFATVAN